ncbi:hypothetical protein AB0O28_39410 [Microbispora sp. NPDC088329]|uniref:hypothetical protein n=1 Tax=Microbispora sp. NPDC088329 TaxID=3154869 RepID=UPI003437C700
MNIINGRIVGDAEDYDGDIGTVIGGEPGGAVHLGKGNIISQTFDGPGVIVVNGTTGGISQTFVTKSKGKGKGKK